MARINDLISAEAEIKKIEEEAERAKNAVRAKLADAIAARKHDVAAVVEKVGALAQPDELIGGALLVLLDADDATKARLTETYRARFPAPKPRRGRPKSPKTAGGDQGSATVGAATQANEPQAAE